MLRCLLLLFSLSACAAAFAQSQQNYFDQFDADQSGSISLAEFQAGMRYAFDRIDSNRNDVIDADEAIVPKMRGMTRARHQRNIAAQFRRQDKDHSGGLSVAELTDPY
jgi:Ca2+-binding EF-hand superfamily protein